MIFERTFEAATCTGTSDPYALTGAQTGYRAFTDVGIHGDEFYYCAVFGPSWEVGKGILSTGAGNTLSRDTIYASSNGGSAVDWAGTENIGVFTTVPADKLLYIEPDGVIPSATIASLDINSNHSLESTGNAVFCETTGQVGIGTNAPSALLDMEGESDFEVHINATGSDPALPSLVFQKDGSEIGRIKCVGYAADNAYFDVDPDTLDGTSKIMFRLFRNANTTGDALLQILAGDGTATINHSFDGKGDALFCLNAGKLGIGTASPAEELHVVGDVLFEDTSPSLTFNDSNAASTSAVSSIIEWTDSGENRAGYIGFASVSDADLTIQATDATGELAFHTAATEAMRITSDGYVGIGTASPDQALVVEGAGAEIVLNDTDSRPTIRMRAAGSTVVTLDGIKNAPGSLDALDLNVYPDPGDQAWMRLFRATNTTNNCYLQVASGDGAGTENHSFNGKGDALLCQDVGRVGIGTANPARKLHVDATLRLEPTTEPANGAAGDLYYDSSTNKLRCHNGTAWQDCF
jgi:hypothetical protein